MPIEARPTVAAPDDDPYLWLESIDGALATAWADGESAKTLTSVLTPAALRDRDMLAALLDRPDKIAMIGRRAAYVYNFWQDRQNPRGLWRRTTLADFKADAPTWDVLLDVDALAIADGEDWVWQGPIPAPGDSNRVIICLSRGGSDARVQREFDLMTRSFVADGFILPEAKGNVQWWDHDTVLVASAYGGDAFVTTSGYARTIRLWRRGTSIDHAPVIFEVDRSAMSCGVDIERTSSPPSLWFIEVLGFYDIAAYRGSLDGARHRIDIPTHVRWEIHRGTLIAWPRKAWDLPSATIPPDHVVAFPLDEFERGARTITTLFESTDRSVLQGWTLGDGTVTLSILDNLQSRFETWSQADGQWTRRVLGGLPANGVTQVWRLDNEEDASNGDLLSLSQDPLTPPTLSLIEAGKAPVVLKQAPANFDVRRQSVRQFEAIARDGERIPYTVTGPVGPATGDAPVYMRGYGGFQVSERPTYNTSIGKLWLERGGTAVVTNIRGGGEFGTRWHEAGRREKKITAHDDFAEIAADLVTRGITKPSRIAAEGGSNGGILISNMLTRYPDHFGALFCTIPLIDMRRYHKLLAGASWIAEYGDPDCPEDWAFLQRYSAYHTAEPGQPYPPILVATTRKDDRVHPGHARKFAAKLQAMGYTNALYFESPTGGHGYGKDTIERATFTVLGLTFLAQSIGWQWHFQTS